MADTESGRRAFLKDLAVAVIVIASFVAALPAPVVQVPGYLLLVGFEAVSGAVPVLGRAFGFELVAYLLALSALAAALAAPLRDRTTADPWFRAPVVTSLLVVGTALLVVAAKVWLVPAGESPVMAVLGLGAGLVLYGLAAVAQGASRGDDRRPDRAAREGDRSSDSASATDADSSPTDAGGDEADGDRTATRGE